MLLVVMFIVVPIAELWVIVVSSHQFGFLTTLAALLLFSMLGASLVRREGTKVWQRFTTQVDAGKVPSAEIADGVCVLGAGALLMTPGFLTDAVGLLLLFPPTRALARRVLVRRFTGRPPVVRATHIPPAGGRFGRGSVFDTTGRPTADVDPSGENANRAEVDGELTDGSDASDGSE